MGLLRWMALAMVLAGLSTMDGQQASGAAQAGRPMCGPDHTAPSDADKAMLARKFADAERLYAQALAADPSSTVAMAGMIRATMEQGKLADALTLAMKDDSAHPNNAELLDALGEVRFRRGEVDEAARTFNRAVAANPCSGLTHYDMANYLHLAGYYGSAQRQLETAHTLAPDDPRITGLWKSTHAVPLTVEQRLEVLKRRATSPSLTAEQKDSLDAAIKGMEAQGRGNCELVTPMVATKLPITPISSGFDPWETMYEAALELKINGKKKRLEIDTGACAYPLGGKGGGAGAGGAGKGGRGRRRRDGDRGGLACGRHQGGGVAVQELHGAGAAGGEHAGAVGGHRWADRAGCISQLSRNAGCSGGRGAAGAVAAEAGCESGGGYVLVEYDGG
jgi:tetratricopeptide (TPR) repeat protein